MCSPTTDAVFLSAKAKASFRSRNTKVTCGTIFTQKGEIFMLFYRCLVYTLFGAEGALRLQIISLRWRTTSNATRKRRMVN
jgi:hypothetical protein